MFYKLLYFKKSQDGICGEDFKNEQKTETINLKFLLSLSGLIKYENPFSGRFVGNFAIVTMSNNDRYFIDMNSFFNVNQFIRRHTEINID